MKRHLHLFIVLISVSIITSAQQKNSATSRHNGLNSAKTVAPVKGTSDDNWQAAALQYLDKAEYHSKKISGKFAFANKKQQLSFATNGMQLQTVPFAGNAGTSNGQWASSLALAAVGDQLYDADLYPHRVEAKAEYLKFHYADFAIEYINKDNGLRQNFIINKKEAGSQKLSVRLRFSGDLTPELSKKNVLVLRDPASSKKILQYDDLKVWDKNHQVLEAEMQLTANNDLLLVVDDSRAAYPITIDPLTHVPDWTTSANGVLPGLLTNLQLQIDALYGYTVEGVGDVNNDGYDDVAIGAPGAIDIIAGPSTIVGAGAVFVYFGSATGLPVTPSRVLRATTPVTSALFGYSIGSGNVTGSILAGSVNNDIIVGAPGDSYSTSVAGVPSTATVTAGKVYIFDGAQLQAGPASPLLSIYLDGSDFFSRGVAGLLGSNYTVNALFGFSVAGTDDMDADGRAEVIVGAPGYKGVELLDVASGAAFVYRSVDLVSNTPTQLDAPSLISYPLLVNLNGLLFGFSVDGAGDYDKDTRPDVVVGAPGGVSLGLPNLLGGSAYVYSGNGAGVNTAITTQLKGTGPLLGAVANLFGYDVKGARNAAGSRTGNIIVGAPAGNVLSNLLPGLRLKTGTVYVFASKLTPGSTELSLQSFSSPRGAILLAQLASLDINVSALFGASIDNMRDVNCDGIADLIVGEPLSTGVGIVSANTIGGAAFIFTGKADGTFNIPPFWTLENTVSFDFGINAGSLLGYSVAGAGYTNGPLQGPRALVGAPGAALDFSTGIFNLSNTFGTLFSFVAGNNGLGKAYAFSFNCPLSPTHPDIGVTYVNVQLSGNTNTNDVVPAPPATQYGTPIPSPTNLPGATITMFADGTYIFTATTAGVYAYSVPVCTAGRDCVSSALTITVLNANNNPQPPIANTDIAITNANTPVSVSSLQNDEAGYIGGSLNPATVMVVVAPKNGTTSVNPGTGVITYTPNSNFTGQDTLIYSVCDMSLPPLCAFAAQVYTVQSSTAANATLAADDFNYTAQGSPATGNVKINDTDPEGNLQTVTANTITVPGVGMLSLLSDGSYTFAPSSGFTGPISFAYTTCDNGAPQACATATLHILVLPLVTTPVNITSFSAQQQSCNAKLNWKTSGEINTARFDIELSTDNGRTFSVIGSATARGSNSSYTFNYGMKNELSHLYRLKAVDQNGSVTLSEMVNLRSGCGSGKEESYVFPSPATSVLNLRVSNNALVNTYADVYDLNGKKLSTIRLGSNQTKINVSSFTAGIYLIKLADGTTLKFIKQ